MSSIGLIKQAKRLLIRRHARAKNFTGLIQVAVTLAPLSLLFWAAAVSAQVSLLLAAALTLLVSLLMVRVFALLHECGHGSLFRSQILNRAFGFVFGVVSGMPQYVWSQHHNYHHLTNGNWDKYRGPLTTLSVDEYEALSVARRSTYRLSRHLALAPFGGFIYLIFNPRFTWLKGSIGFLLHVLGAKIAQPGVSFAAHADSFKTRYWRSRSEYWHMFWNNIVLLSLWGLLSWTFGPLVFFSIYIVSVSIAGGAGIALFTVQHNFDQAYASGAANWDIDVGAIEGTSFLILPAWLNWITANIGYHHIHHLSAAIPGYRLPQ
jgi:omega-6 fatty acid desaturase (delta-12 desaturase)